MKKKIGLTSSMILNVGAQVVSRYIVNVLRIFLFIQDPVTVLSVKGQ